MRHILDRPILFYFGGFCLLLAIAILFDKLSKKRSGFTGGLSLAPAPANADLLAPANYPRIARGESNYVPDRTSADNWWHYPTFAVGSYDQITNNIRYSRNPDDGWCTRAEFCGALYHDDPTSASNYAQVLPPVDDSGPGPVTRVGYYTTPGAPALLNPIVPEY